MAVIARVGSADTSDDLIVWGRLTDLDSERIRSKVDQGPGRDVTLDLREVEEVTEDGCLVLKGLAYYLRSWGRTLTVLHMPESFGTRSFETTALLEDPAITFIGSADADSVSGVHEQDVKVD